MSEVIPFDHWVESDEAKGLEGLELVKGYGDHYRYSSFASGNYDPAEAAQVDAELFTLAQNDGLIDAEDQEAAEAQYFGTSKPINDEDLARVVSQKFYDKEEGEDEVRAYLAARNVEGMDPEILKQREEAAAPFLTEKDLFKSHKSSALRGDQPFAVTRTEEGNAEITFDPDIDEETLTDARIAQVAKQYGIGSRDLPLVKNMLQKPSGLTVSRARAVRNAELRDVFHQTEDEDLQFYRDRVIGAVEQGDYEAAQRYAEDAYHGSLQKEYSKSDVANALVDYAKYVGGSGEHPEFLSTGEVVMPAVLHTRKKDFDAAVNALEISDEQKALTKAGRDAKMESMAPAMHKLATSFGKEGYTRHYEAGKAEGKTEGQIVEEWFSDKENFDKGVQAAQGTFFGFLEGFGGLVLYPMALAGHEDAKETVGSLMAYEERRNQYAATFGEKMGIGYTIARTAPSVAADIALAIPTGGTVGAASAGARWTMKQGAKLMFRQALSAGTKQATKTALKKGTAGSVAQALKMTGDDFATKLGAFAKQSAAIAPTAFNRSAGATYVSVYGALEDQHPDWSPEQVREAAYGHAVVSGAITVGITSAFNGLAQAFPKYFGAGVEEWATTGSGGLTVRQLRNAYKGLAQTPHKIPKEIRNYIKLDSFEEFVGSVAKEGMKNSWLLHVGRNTASEAVEEGLDEFINGWRQSAFTNDGANILDHLSAAGHAAVVGGVFGVGGALKAGGVRSTITDRQRQDFESGAFSTIADALEAGGDVESATVMRGLISRANERRTNVSRQLEALGRAGRRQETQVKGITAPVEKILKADPRVPSSLQRELRKAEEFVQALESVDPSKLSDDQRKDLAAARIFQRRLTESFNEAHVADIEGVDRVSRAPGAVTTEEGTVVAEDKGTKHKRFADDKYSAETKEEADEQIQKINSEIARLGSRGDQITPYQNERVAHLSKQRDALRAQFASPAEEGAEQNRPARQTKPKASKLESALRDVESGLGALQRLEKRNPAVIQSPAHRARKIALRSRRRSLREAIANGSGAARKPVSWKSFPIAQIAQQFNPAVEPTGPGLPPVVNDQGETVFDPNTNQEFNPNIDPESALEAIEKASEAKRKMDAATVKKLEQGKNVTDAELESLATEDPDVQFAETLSHIRALVAALNVKPDTNKDADTPNPDKVKKVRALKVAKEAVEVEEVEETTNQIPEEVVEDRVEQVAATIAENDKGPDPRTAKLLIKGVGLVVITDEGVTFLLPGNKIDPIPATSFAEAEAAAQAWIEANGHSDKDITVTETETDQQTEDDAAVASGDLAPIEAEIEDVPDATAAETELAEDAQKEVVAAKLEAILTNRTAAEILEEKITKEENDTSGTFASDVGPLLSTYPEEGGWEPWTRGGLIATKGFDPDKHEWATPKRHPGIYKKGEHTVVNKKSQTANKTVKVMKLSGAGVTLYDSKGVPRFASEEDKQLFYEFVERGFIPERRLFGKNKPFSIYSHNQNYINPFLATVRAEVLKRYPVVEAPPAAMFKTDPDPSLQEQRVTYKILVSYRDSGSAVFTRSDLARNREELVKQLASGTRKGREEAAIRRAELEVNMALEVLEGAQNLHNALSPDTQKYYDTLQKKATAEARVREKLMLLDELNNKDVSAFTPVGKKRHENRVARASRAVSEAEYQVAGLATELASLPDPRNLPNLTQLEKDLDTAHRKLARAKQSVKAGDFAESTLQQQIADIDELMLNSPKDESYVIEFKEGDVPLTARTQRRLDDIHKGNKRGLREALKKTKLSRNGETINVSLPIVEKIIEEKDGTTRTVQEVVFTNEPLVMASALNMGYSIRVPLKFRGDSKTRNPSIKVNSEGYITEVFHPIKNKWVRNPGDLMEFAGDEAFVPSELADNNPRARYVGSLPPVRYEDLPHLGSTPLGIESDRVMSVYHPETIGGERLTEEQRQEIADEHGLELKDVPEFTPMQRQKVGSPDEEYFSGAADFFDGIFGGDRMAAPRNRVNRVKRSAFKEYDAVVAPLRRQLEQLRTLQDNEQVSTQPVIPADLATELGAVDVIGLPDGDVQVNESQLATLISRTETAVSEAEAAVAEAAKGVKKGETQRKRKRTILQKRLDETIEAIAEHSQSPLPRGAKKHFARVSEATDKMSAIREEIAELEGKPRTKTKVAKLKKDLKKAREEADAVQASAPKAVTDRFEKGAQLEEERDSIRSEISKLSEADSATAREEYRTALLRSDNESSEALKAAKDKLDKSLQAEVELEVAEEQLAVAQGRWQALTMIQSTMEQARAALVDPETGENIVPTNLEDLIQDLSNKLGDAQRSVQTRVREAEAEFDQEVADVVHSGQHVHPQVARLNQLVDKTGGQREDARTVAILLYQQEIREFGIAMRLLEKNNEGKDAAKWFRKYLKTLSPEARADFMAYVRSRYKTKTARTFTSAEALAFFGEHGKKVKTKFNKWLKTKRKPDKLTERQLKSFIAKEVKDPELAGVLHNTIKAEEQQTLTDEFVIKNYVDRLLLDLTPEAGDTTRWVQTPNAIARPPSFLQVVRTLQKRYRDFIRHSSTVEVVHIDNTRTDEEGNELVTVDLELAEAIQAAWEEQSTSRLSADLTHTEFFVNALKRIEKSPAAQDSLRRVALELGALDSDSRPLTEIWMMTHERLLNDPETVALLPTDMQRVIRQLYSGGLARGTDFGAAEEIHDNIDENRVAYIRRLNSAGLNGKDVLDDGMFGSQTKKFVGHLIESDDVLSPQAKQIFKSVSKFLDENGPWPDVTFLTTPAAAYGTFTGAYASETGTIYINFSKKDLNRSETMLRGLLQHILDNVPAETAGLADLKDAAADIIAEFPGTKQLITHNLAPDVDSAEAAVRFAMNDPVMFDTVARKKPKWNDRVVRAVAKILGLKGDVAHRRLRPYVEPSRRNVWGGEPKQRRHTAKTDGVSESPIDIIERLAPPGINIVVSNEHRQPAWVSTLSPDKVFVNPETVIKLTGDLSPESSEQVLRALLNHELAHLASLATLTDADRQAILADMTEADFATVQARVPAGTGGIEYAEEFLRMKVEEATNGIDSDRFIQSVLNYGSGFRARVVRYVERFLNQIRALFGQRPSLSTAVHIDRVAQALAQIQRGGLDLRPVEVADIDGHLTALEELVDGTERTFFSVPVHSTQDGLVDRAKGILRHSNMRKELRELDNQVKFAQNALQGITRDFQLKVRAAAKRGTPINEDQINKALGSTTNYITEQQEAMLVAQREADVAAKLPAPQIEANYQRALLQAQKAAVLQREAEQTTALADISRVDPVLANDIKNFRANITDMSRKVGQVHDGGSLQPIFDSRANVHLIRSYEFFNSRAWVEAALHAKDDKGVKGYRNVPFNSLRSQAIDDIKDWYARQYGKKIDGKKAWSLLNGWLNELSGVQPSVMQINTLTKKSDLFKSRDEIPAGVRALLGEHSAVESAANTTFKLGTYLAKHDAARDVRKLLLDNGWATTNPKSAPGLAPLWNSFQEDTEYEALHGLFAAEEDVAVIEETLSTILPTRGQAGNELATAVSKGVKQFFGVSLTLKTLFSIGFFTRNEGSNSFYLLPMQGHWGAMLGAGGVLGKGRDAANIAWGGLGSRQFAEGAEEYTAKLLKLGIIHDDVTVGLLRDLNGSTSQGASIQEDIQDFAAGNKPKGWIGSMIKRIAKAEGVTDKALATMSIGQQVTSFLAKINEVIDAKAKIQLFELELDTLKKVRDEVADWSNKPDYELERMAAAKVHATMQGHSQVYDSVKKFTGSPVGLLIAPFARFKSEMVRIMKNTPQIAWEEWQMGKELNSPTLKARAMRRAVSFGIVNTVWSSVLVSLFGALFDAMDDDRKDSEEGFTPLKGEVGKALRMGLPRWSRNHTIFARRNSDGTITTFDMTYYNPLSLLHDPVKVFWDRAHTDGIEAGIAGFTDAMVTDFIGEGIGPGAVRQIFDNSDDYGREIWLPTDDLQTKTEKIISHYLTNALEPAIMSKTEQVYQAITRKDQAVEGDRFYDAANIIVGEAVGVRPRDYVESELMKRSARTTKLDLDRVQRLLSPLNSPGFRTDKEIQDAIDAHVEAYTELWVQHRRNAAAWAQFTGDDKIRLEYAKRMIDAGHSKDRTRKAIFGGVVDRPVRSRAGIETIVNSGNTAGAEGGELRARRAVDHWLTYPRLLSLEQGQ